MLSRALILLALTAGCTPVADSEPDLPEDTGTGDVESDTDTDTDTELPPIPSVSGACRAPVEVEVTYVTDGDTVKVSGPQGSETVRIIGVDTPEIDHGWGGEDCYGEVVAAYAEEGLEGRKIWLSLDKDCDDAYDRTLAYVYLVDEQGEIELFEESLLELGYARPVHLPQRGPQG